MTKNLRPYQLQAIANVEDNINAGVDKHFLNKTCIYYYN